MIIFLVLLGILFVSYLIYIYIKVKDYLDFDLNEEDL